MTVFADAAVKFGVDEIAEAAEHDADGSDQDGDVANLQEAHGFAFVGAAAAVVEMQIEPEGDNGADQSAVKGQPPLPEGQHFGGIFQVKGQVVEKYIAEPAAEDDAENGADQQIVFLVVFQGKSPAGAGVFEKKIAKNKGGQIH